MIIRLKTKVSLSAVVAFFIAICVYIRSGSPFSLAYQSTSLFLHLIMSGIVIVCSFICKPTERISPALRFLTALFCISILGTMLKTNEIAIYRNYVVQILMCIDAVLIVRLLGVEKTIKYWIVSMRAIVLAALILYFFVLIGVTTFPIVETNASTYYTIYIASQLSTAVRLSGSFWEPSMLVVFLSITILLELLSKENRGEKHGFWLIIEIVALLLTVSGSAVVSLLFVAFIYYYSKNKDSKSRGLFVSLVFFVCIFAMLFFEDIIMLLYDVFPSFFYKFVERDSSFLTRVNNPIGDMLTCITNPFGVGVQNVEDVVRRNATLFTGDIKAVISRTSTWSYYFAAFGWISGISVNLIWIIGICKSHWLKGLQKFAFVAFVFYLLTSVTLVSNQLYWIFIVLICVSSNRTQLQTQALS